MIRVPTRRGILLGAVAAPFVIRSAHARGFFAGTATAPPPPLYTGQIATATTVPEAFVTFTGMMSRSRHIMMDGSAGSFKVMFPNWYVNNQGAETHLTNGTTTITASIEYPAGTFTQVLFSGIAAGSIAQDAILTSDSILLAIPNAAAFWVRSFATNAGILCYNGVSGSPALDTANGEACTTSGATDQTMGGTVVNTGGNKAIIRPCGIIGSTRLVAVGILGDSICYGVSDVYNNSGADIGLLTRSIGPLYAYMKLATGNARNTGYVAASTHRIALAQFCSHLVNNCGRNDLFFLNPSLATFKTNMTTIANAFALPMWWSTMTPGTTSTDLFATTVNQSAQVNFDIGLNGTREQLNNFERAGGLQTLSVHFGGYIEAANMFETAQDSGIWKVNGTANWGTGDGTHPQKVLYVFAQNNLVLPAFSR